MSHAWWIAMPTYDNLENIVKTNCIRRSKSSAWSNKPVSVRTLNFSEGRAANGCNLKPKHFFAKVHTVEPPWATASRKRPPLLSDNLTKILIGSSVSQIAICETSRKRPPKSDINGVRLRGVPLYLCNRYCSEAFYRLCFSWTTYSVTSLFERLLPSLNQSLCYTFFIVAPCRGEFYAKKWNN